MKFLTIDKIKQQLRLDCTCEAELLDAYGNSAEATLAAYIGFVDEHLAQARLSATLTPFSAWISAAVFQMRRLFPRTALSRGFL